MERDRSGFFAALAGPGRGVSINPKDRLKRAEEDEESSWNDSEEEGVEVDVSDVDDEEGGEEGEGEEELEEEGEEEEEEEEGDGVSAEDAEEMEGEEKVKRHEGGGVRGAIEGVETIRIAEGQEQDTTSWLDIPLDKRVRHAVAECGWVMPTPVQCKAIPAAVDGYDVCCRAVTGSGKTGTFLIPILQRLLTEKKTKACIRAVALLPTRELAVQCFNMLEQLSQGMDITKSLVIGGLSVAAQQRELRNRPEVVVATPGRLIDSLRNAKGVTLDGLDMLVLDEADRLLSLGFRQQLEELLRFCPKSRQTLLLSATMTREVNELAALSLEKPINVDVGHVAVAANLSQEFVRLPAEKEDRARMWFISCLCSHEFKRGVIIFCEKKSRAQRVKIILELQGISCAELHQSVSQTERLQALDRFRNREVNVLVTTEVAARGLDIEGVRTVINYDLPKDITGYVHRVGRTARIGNRGRAVSFVGAADLDLMKKVIRLSKAQLNSVQTSKVRQRTVDEERVKAAEKTIDMLQPRIKQHMEELALQRDLAEAEKQVSKRENTLKHLEEIKARPKATWFASETEKRLSKKREREAMESDAQRDLSEYDIGPAFHSEKRKEGEYGSKMARLEARAAQQEERAPKSDKYGKLYSPQQLEKPRGKSLKKANAKDWVAKRRQAKQDKLEKAAANRKGAKHKVKSGADKKKEWNFKERKGVSFKSKKRYKRH